MSNKGLPRNESEHDITSKFTVIGIDILPGRSPDSRQKAHFAAVVLDQNGNIVHQQPNLTIRRILGLTRKTGSKYLAVDNIHEIVRDRKGVQAFAEQLPDSCTLVQVAGSPRAGYAKITTLAKSLGLTLRTKPDSMETAEIVARLCLAGLGFKVVTFEDEVKIAVTRGRSRPHQGGWSQSRYQRNLEIAVARATKAFKDFLKSHEYDYDIYDEFGRRSVFFVALKSERDVSFLRSAKRKFESDLVRLSLDPIPKSTLEFVPLSATTEVIGERPRTRNIIVGLDPGITIGLSIIDLRGKVLEVTSKREFSTSAIIRTIGRFGKPVIVAADVKPIPGMVEKIARTFGATLIGPRQAETPVSEKRQRIEEFRELCKSSHERDSLFAALNAFDSITHSLKRTEEVIRDRYPEMFPSLAEIERQVILGQSIESAIQSLRKPSNAIDEKVEIELQKESRSQLRERLESQQSLLQKKNQEIDDLQSEIASLQKELQKTEYSRSELFEKYTKLKKRRSKKVDRDRKVSEKIKEISRLKNNSAKHESLIVQLRKQNAFLQRVKAVWERGDMILLKTMPRFTDQEIETLDREIGLTSGDVVLVLDPSGGGSKTADRLVAKEIRAIIVPEEAPEMSHLAESEFRSLAIPVLHLPLVNYGFRKREHTLVVDDLDDLYLIEKKPLEKEIQRQESKLLAELRKKEQTKKKDLKKAIIAPREEKHPVEQLLEAYRREWIENHQEPEDSSYHDDSGELRDEIEDN
ncbi:MAG: DUF460 domain-containing protein [Candidatus Hodarchaeales archaeon]|jgi:predicted RNase H-like nuclease (RuvC/YqgF family)